MWAKNFADNRKIPVQIMIVGLKFCGFGAPAKFRTCEIDNHWKLGTVTPHV